MRLPIGLLLSALVCCACGSSSGDSLFNGSNNGSGSCAAPVACTGDGFCAGHAACDASGKPGACVCDSTGASGGAQNAGGASNSGGSTTLESGGTTADAAPPSENTGGQPVADSGIQAADAAVLTECPAGDYDGKLTGTYKSGGGLVKADVGATVHFTITSDGAVSGKYAGPSGANATLVGTVDCTTGKLHITIKNGSYLPPAAFNGSMEGQYDPSVAKFVDGSWSITEPLDGSDGGNGDWTQTS